ncbi:MAG: toxin [Prevotellaceae bacterium]|nr:toxin [Prevotellaceae bacterium]
MVTKEEVELFLSRFVQKVKVFGIVFRDERGKNMRTLLELEITPRYREDVVMSLSPDDYIEGPIEDTLHKMGEMWVFGKDVKGRDIYIKISLGVSGLSAVCISFHIAERPIIYKFKES